MDQRAQRLRTGLICPAPPAPGTEEGWAGCASTKAEANCFLEGAIRIACAHSNLRYNPRHYAQAKNEGPQAFQSQEAQKSGCWRQTAQRRGHTDRPFARARR